MQKTAYEMRISDWSSDVCSSDLLSEVGLSGIHEAKKYLLGAQIGLHQIAECGTVRTRPSQLAFVLGHSLDVVLDGATRADDAFAVQSVRCVANRHHVTQFHLFHVDPPSGLLSMSISVSEDRLKSYAHEAAPGRARHRR